MNVYLCKRELPSHRVQVYLKTYRGKDEKVTSETLFVLPRKTSRDRFEFKEAMKQARDVLAQRRSDFRANENGLPTVYNRKASFIKFLNDQAELRTKPNTKASWKRAIDHFSKFAGESITFGSVDPKLIERFKNHLLNNVKVSANSAHTYLSRIKTALNEAVRDDILAANPANRTIVKREETLPVHLSIKEIRKLSKTPCGNEQVKQAFLFSCFSGLRYSDVDRLTWDKIRGEYLEFTQKKTGAPERFPLSAQALQILAKQKRAKASPSLQREIPANSVFLLPCASGINKDLKHWAKAAGIDKPLTFHKARHFFATIALTSGVDIYTVSKLLGHKSISQTQVYGQIIDDKKRRAVNRLPRL